MVDSLNTFPLVIAVREDGSLGGTIDNIEKHISGSMARAGRSAELAGEKANKAFDFSGAKRDLDRFSQSIAALNSRTASANADPFGYKAQIAALNAAPFQKSINERIAGENSLAQQSARATADRVAGIQREVSAALEGYRARQAAQTAMFQQAESQGRALIALDQQRLAESAKLVAGPSQAPISVYFDPKGSQAAAVAARQQADALSQVARAAEQSATANIAATAADRALALTMREAAIAAAGEAGRLEELAAAQARVAAAAVAAGGKLASAGELVTNSVRGQRFATIQASQQFQDFFIQIQGGQNPLVAFSQQASQLAFVMSNTGGTAGKLAAFFGGPWGTAIFAGLSVLSLLTSGLFDNAEASKEAEVGAKKFGDRQADIKNFIDQTTGALNEQNKTLRLNAVLTRQAQIAKNDAIASDARQAALKSASKASTRIVADPRNAEGGGLALGIDPDVSRAVAAAGGNIDKLSESIARLAQTSRPDLKGLALDITTQGGAAILASRENARLNKELQALAGDRNASFTSPSQVAGLVAIAAAATPAARKLAQLNEQMRALQATVSAGSFKGTRDEYVTQAAALQRQIDAQERAVSVSKKKDRSGKADANRIAGERRQELFAEAKAIGDGTDAIKSANSQYEATIVSLKNKLREGLISDADAKAAAINARQIRNAAVDAAQGSKQLDQALQQIGQQFDGDSSFVNRIQKAQAAIEEAIKQVDPLTGVAKIGDHEYAINQLLEQQGRLRAEAIRPITEANRQLAEQAQIDAAILAGREDEADFLRLKFQILSQFGNLQGNERAEIEAQIAPLRTILDAEYQRTEAIRKRSLLIDTQVRAAQDLQSAVTDALTKPFEKGGLNRFNDALTSIRQRQIAETLSIQLFGGDLGSKVHDALTRNAQPLTSAASAHVKAAEKWDGVANKINGFLTGADSPSLAAQAATPTAFGLAALGGLIGPGVARASSDGQPGDIVVNGKRQTPATIGGAIPIKIGFDQSSLPDLSALAGAQSDAERRRAQAQSVVLNYAAQVVGGKGGAFINAYQNTGVYNQIGNEIAKEIRGSVGSKLGGAVKGYGVGSTVAAGFDLVGIKGGATGAKIGGTIGGLTGNPLIAAGASVLGGLIGSLFYKAPRGDAGISVSNGGFSATAGSGTSGKAAAAAAGLAGGVADGLTSIAKQLGGLVSGSTDVRIGTYKGEYRVNDHGGAVGGVKGSGAVGFGDDQAAAITFAIKAALEDGVITGIRESTRRILAAGNDLTAQLQKATDFESVFVQLKQYTDPVGAAVDALDKQFDYLRSVFAEAGASTAEYSDLESLYALKRAEAVRAASQDLTSTLQSLLDNLRYKGDSGLSLRTREKNARAAFDPLAATVRSGGIVDQQEFSDAAQAYLDIERQLYGSTTEYFAKLADITALTGQAITNAGGTIKGGPIISNDNSPGALAAALVEQTDKLAIPAGSAALFTSPQFADAVAAGLTTAAPQLALVQPSNADVVAALNAQTNLMSDGFNLMIATTSKLASGGGGGTTSRFSEGLAYTLREA